MKRYIHYNTNMNITAEDKLQAGQKVNKIAKYIKKHTPGAYKLTFSPMTADVYITIYYQVPEDVRNLMKKYDAKLEHDELQSMDIDISITSYQNKIRINVIRMDDNEKTLGHFVLKPEDTQDLNSMLESIKAKVSSYIEKEYADYDFVF